ncbi:MAG: dATP/dGTP diphosphohydrolase domain-containing protein [Sulfurimonas sp.]
MTVPIRFPGSQKSGIKKDDGKPRYSLIPPKPLEDIAEVFTFGAKKYADKNYLLIEDESRIIDALMRHTDALRRGEYIDKESGKPHTAHISCNAMMLQERREYMESLNDSTD